jgi:hypothetical protein
MPSRKAIARVYDNRIGRNNRAIKNAKHRERWRGIRESIGSDQSIKRTRKRLEREARR